MIVFKMLRNIVLWRTLGRRELPKCPLEQAENVWEEREKNERGEKESESARERERLY